MRIRFRTLSALLLVAVAVAFVPKPAGAQSLAEIAEKEKERRKKEKPAKVYTEDDLQRASGKNANIMGGAAPSEGEQKAAEAKPGEAKAGATQEKSADEQKAEREKDWRDRLQKAQADVTRLTDEVNSLQAQANDLTGNLYTSNRANLLSRLEDAKAKLAAAQQTLADLQEEGRRNGFR